MSCQGKPDIFDNHINFQIAKGAGDDSTMLGKEYMYLFVYNRTGSFLKNQITFYVTNLDKTAIVWLVYGARRHRHYLLLHL